MPRWNGKDQLTPELTEKVAREIVADERIGRMLYIGRDELDAMLAAEFERGYEKGREDASWVWCF